MLRKLRLIAALILLAVLTVAGQTAPVSQADVEARAESLLKQLSLEEKVDLIGGQDDFYIRAIPHIHLPRLRMSDGPVGVRNYGPSTAVGGVGLAASWDPEMAQRVGTIFGQDARARGVHFLLGPGVNIYRAPLNGRNFEYYGEDPFLSARTLVAYIRGLQSQGVSATVKHFMGNNSEFDRHNSDSIIDERTMREIYLPTFETAVKEAHVGAIMDSYNLTNGLHLTQDGPLNSDLAKKEWGFQGILMSDWDATYDGVAAANGGLDLEMPSGKFMNRATLLPAIRAGKVSEATIDDKVRRILRTAIQFGWMDRDQTDASVPLFNPQGRQVALEAARAGMVLLKNEGNLLPLDKGKIKSIAVIGPDAYPAQPVGGGSAAVQPFAAVSFLEGIANYPSGAKVYYESGIPTLEKMAKETKFTTEATGGQAGLKAEYFSNLDLSGRPCIERIDNKVSYDPATDGGEAASPLSVRWTGYLTPSTPGEHLVFVQGPGENGGYRLYVDKKLVMDDWTQAYAFLNQIKIPLQSGPHQVELDYFVKRGWGKIRANFGIVRPEELVKAEAKAVAAKADAVVVAVGFDQSSEGESADRMFALPPGQDELIKQIAAVNKNTVVVVTSGGGVDMSAWVDGVPGLLQAWYPGQEGGTALAQLLFGDYSPSGKLPLTMERRWEDNPAHDTYYPKGGDKKVVYSEGVFIGYRGYEKSGVKPLFPFGYGLSYTTFAYKNLTVSPAGGDQQAVVHFDLTNTGSRAGAEVAEVYVGDRHSSVPRPLKELKGFAKVSLSPGETKQVTVNLDRRAFSYYDVKKHDWVVEPGDFDVYVGRSSAQIELTGKVAVGR
ncbi:MAG TPA: glycoside hydrolase family 3 C-terminal domain-containing protein [Terriglobales bacterium]|jgi:beta-glucosidase|nr:glycoside hydrolase family 3 C-terminal domain-containing protein [Terriglobales bacterium]